MRLYANELMIEPQLSKIEQERNELLDSHSINFDANSRNFIN